MTTNFICVMARLFVIDYSFIGNTIAEVLCLYDSVGQQFPTHHEFDWLIMTPSIQLRRLKDVHSNEKATDINPRCTRMPQVHVILAKYIINT